MQPSRVRASLPILAFCALAACGGGGGGSSTPPAPLATPTPTAFVVSNLGDSGAGSLRAAITAVDAAPAGSASVITFSVSGTIVLASALPQIVANVKIDGTTAPGYAGSVPVIAVDANGNAGVVFATGSNNAQLLGMAVENASGNGVTLNASSVTIKSNYIGVNLAGVAAGNGGDGVYVTGSNNTLTQNVVSGNTGNGVSLHDAATNTIAANRIGTNPAGTAALGNGRNGIWLTAGSSGNEIGGTVYTNAAGQSNDPTGNKGTATPTFVIPALGNLISGNGADGVLIDTLSVNNTLNGNFIGTNAAGLASLGNAGDGVAINGAGLNALIGCGVTNNPFVYYNVVSGNGGNGLHVTSSDNVTVQGNFFGIGADNTTIVANAGDGVLVDGSSHNTQVGGVIPLGNVAAGNAKNGIEVTGTAAGFTTFNTFGGLLAFKGAAPNGNDGVLITATGGNQTVRTNVLSGNANNGLEIGGSASGVTVDPNIIGLDTTGFALLPNGNDGVLIDGNANNNAIGGYLVSVIPQNTFSGNKGYGIAITGSAYANAIFNTYIGTGVLGVSAMPNQLGGMYVGGSATNNVIGGAPSQNEPLRNLISGNGGYGVTLDAGTSFIEVVGNVIGVDPLGVALPNASGPIFVNPASTSDTISGNITTP
jgi:parallel beta-helix repeat protein